VIRTLVRLVTVAAVAATTLLVPASVQAPGSAAQAADMRLFDAGNIISDAVFFDSFSMDAGAIQRFLDAKGASCAAAEMPCLKDYRQDTADQSVDKMCAGYRGLRGETAATIISKVAASCGISPRVLLVLLQKEQSLVTRRSPTVYAYTHATGFACPDTAPCNPAFSGFVSQVYFAARQFQRYRIEASRYGYKAGRVNTIQWHPNIGCGTSQVFIANQATAGLYNYTPYRPTDAALFSGPAGIPKTDPASACAAYGNRNFWTYFTDWFGSTQSTGAGEILTKYLALGGPGGKLGAPTSGYICGLVRGGCFANYQGGSIYWSPASGAHTVRGAIGGSWGSHGWERGWLGYPTGDEVCGLVRGGCLQLFQGAAVYWSPATGVQPIQDPVTPGYQAQGWERGLLGYPTGRQVCGLVRGGCFQGFQGGTLYTSPATGGFGVRGAILGTYGALGWERGWLGYPTGADTCGTTSTSCRQAFQGGTMYWSPATGAHPVRGAIATTWSALGGTKSALGHPTGNEICGLANGGCFQTFAKGAVYWSPATGAHPVSGAIRGTWGSLGWERGWLGYPTGDDTCGTGVASCRQAFQGGTMYWSPATGAHPVRGAFAAYWTAQGGPTGWLGHPTGNDICGLVAGGCFQTFAGGSVYTSPATGTHAVSGAIRDAWGARGWEKGPLGYPVEDARPLAGGGTSQRFFGGTLTLDAASGVVAPS
jgi:uncharacterized protein with LGFP repeats